MKIKIITNISAIHKDAYNSIVYINIVNINIIINIKINTIKNINNSIINILSYIILSSALNILHEYKYI